MENEQFTELYHRAQMLQHENTALSAELAAMKKTIDDKASQISLLEQSNQELREALIVADRDRQWARTELERCAAQLEIVELIFAGRRGFLNEYGE